MSLPSIAVVASEIDADLNNLSEEQQERILVEAMKRDLPDAIKLLHQKAHEADKNNGRANWVENPNSPVGKQLIRLHASDALRPLASKHFCHGKLLTFLNCCGGYVGEPPKNLLLLQIHHQTGVIAKDDC